MSSTKKLRAPKKAFSVRARLVAKKMREGLTEAEQQELNRALAKINTYLDKFYAPVFKILARAKKEEHE